MKTILILFLFIGSSCHYFIPSKNSQLYYQKHNSYSLIDSYEIKKFNIQELDTLIAENPTKKYFVMAHFNPECGPMNRYYKNTKKIIDSFSGDSVYLIPIIHDYLNSIRSKFLDTLSYNKQRKTFYTDLKKYGKGLNPNINYERQFLSKLYNTTQYPFKNIKLHYKGKTLLICSWPPIQNKRMKDFNSILDDVCFIDEQNPNDFINLRKPRELNLSDCIYVKDAYFQAK